MKRRDFLNGVVPALATIPFIGGMFKDVQASDGAKLTDVGAGSNIVSTPKTSTFDSVELNKLVKEYITHPRVTSRQLIFEERTPTIDYTDPSEMIAFKGTLAVADTLSDNQDGVVYDTVGVMHFTALEVPTLKVGSRVGELMILREYKRRNGLDTNPHTEQYMRDWKNTLAETLAISLKQRKNTMLAAFMLGADNFHNFGIMLNLDLGVPEGVHSKSTSTHFKTKPLATIRKHLRYMKTKHGVSYDRVTLSSEMFKQIILNAENKKLRRKADAGVVRQRLAKHLNLEIEIYDGCFFERGNNGSRVSIRYMAENKILFSNSKNDNNPEVIHFGNTYSSESIINGLFSDSTAEFGPHGYFTTPLDFNPPSVTGWGVIRGLPVLKDKTAFASLTIEDK